MLQYTGKGPLYIDKEYKNYLLIEFEHFQFWAYVHNTYRSTFISQWVLWSIGTS